MLRSEVLVRHDPVLERFGVLIRSGLKLNQWEYHRGSSLPCMGVIVASRLDLPIRGVKN